VNWDALNQPLSVTIVGFLLGGVLASLISAFWQRRSQRHSVRLELMQDLLRCYQEYMRFLRRPESDTDDREFDRLHSEFVSRTKMAGVLFGAGTRDSLMLLAQRMASVHALRKEGRATKAVNKGQEIYPLADSTFEAMYLMLV
jgi:uncharacterized membrane protein YccC